MIFIKNYKLSTVCSQFLILAIFLIVSFIFGKYYIYLFSNSNSDTAFILETISNIGKSGESISYILRQNSNQVYMAMVNIDIFCSIDTLNKLTETPINVLKSLHAYFILYLYAFLTIIFSSVYVLAFVNVITFILIPYIIYIYLKNNKIDLTCICICILIICVHPNWSIASYGQFYVDRLFILITLLYSLILYDTLEKNTNKYNHLLVSIFLLGSLTAERNALIIGIYTIAMYILYSKSYKNSFLVVIGSIGVIWGLFYIFIISGSSDNTKLIQKSFDIHAIYNSSITNGILEYIIFNIILLIPIIRFPKLLIITLLFLLINVFITVGGAEKNGWLTHYHSHYFGVLIASFLISVKCLYVLNKINIKKLLVLLLSFMLLSFIYFQKGNSIISKLIDFYSKNSVQIHQSNTFDDFIEGIRPTGSVSAPDWASSSLYLKGFDVNILPSGIGKSEYVIVSFDATKKGINLTSIVRYDEFKDRANSCISSLLNERYILIKKIDGLALYKKNY